jgi:hypothetical protein
VLIEIAIARAINTTTQDFPPFWPSQKICSSQFNHLSLSSSKRVEPEPAGSPPDVIISRNLKNKEREL